MRSSPGKIGMPAHFSFLAKTLRSRVRQSDSDSQLISDVTLSRGILLPKHLEIGCVTFSGLFKTVRYRVRLLAYPSCHKFFLGHRARRGHTALTATSSRLSGSLLRLSLRTPSPSERVCRSFPNASVRSRTGKWLTSPGVGGGRGLPRGKPLR